MEPGLRPPDGGLPDEDSPETRPPDGGLPWWMGSRARLAVLLVCLGAALLGLTVSRTGLLSAAEEPSAEPRAGGCVRPAPPPLLTVDFQQLKALRAGLLAVMAPLALGRYEWGIASLKDAWSDNSPQDLRSARLSGERWPGSYAMRAWASGDDVVSEVFLFADAAQARTFFQEASSTHCHRAAVARPASWPPGARNLIWVNPDGPTEEDVYLVRGPRVYRVSDVRPQRTPTAPSTEEPAGISRVNALACGLPGAGCRTP